MNEPKPLAYTPPSDQSVGFTAARRPDGGMHLTFTRLDRETLAQWREFAQRHLHAADRQNRNLYDLRAVREIPDEVIQVAEELNSDPAAKFIRLAVVVARPELAGALREIDRLSMGAEIEVFTDLDEAEAWLERPFSRLLS